MPKVKIGDQEHEVEKLDGWTPNDKLAETHIPKGTFEAELTKRTGAIIKNQGYRKPEELLEDAEFKKTFMEKHGLNPDAAAKDLQKEVERVKNEYEVKHLNPIKTKLDAATKLIEKKNQKELHAEILAATGGRAQDVLLKKLGDAPPAIVNMLDRVFGYSEEHDKWFVRKGDGFQYSTTGAAPYKTVEEFMTEWLDDPANKDFVKPTRQDGPGAKPAGTGSDVQGGVLRIPRADARDPQKYRAAREKAAKSGARIEFID
jgi:hypothetical protein